jgi:hypothetical protein
VSTEEQTEINNGLSYTNLQLALLKQEVARLVPLQEKLIVTLDNLKDVSNDIRRLLAVHEEKLATNIIEIGSLKKELLEISARIDTLENWKWWALGVALAMSLLIGGASHAILSHSLLP